MAEIPDDLLKRAQAEARYYVEWLDAGNTTGFLSAHAAEAMADSMARFAMAERAAQIERDAGIAEAVASHADYPDNDWGVGRGSAAAEIAAAIREQKQ